MLHVMNPTTVAKRPAVRLVGIVSFTLLTVVSARMSAEIGTPVPFTLQVLAILLAGLVLGSRDGAISQLGYIGLIAMNLPVDTRMLGVAALVGPTAGFIFGFPVMAFVVGWLTERGQSQPIVRWLAAVVGIGVLYLFGATWLKTVTGMSWSATWVAAVQPFIVLDLLKAVIAAALAESGRWLFLRSR